jgi:hypothetical protein
MDETIEANERAGMPSRAAFDKLMDAIAAEPKPARMIVSQRASGLMARLFGQSGSPWLVAGAAAAALVIMVQAAALGVLLMRDDRGGVSDFRTASGDKPVQTLDTGSFALVRFAPDAKASDILATLHSVNATIVDGPKGGVYTLKVSNEKLTNERMGEIIEKLRARPDIVNFANRKGS